MTADLDRFKGFAALQEEGIDVEIIANGEPLGWTIRVAGPDSERARRIQQRFADEAIKRAEKRNAPQMSGRDIKQQTPQILAELTISWTPVTLFGGDYPCTAENARKLYETPDLFFVRDQVNAAAGDRASFFQRLKGNSAKPSETSEAE